MPRPCKCRQIEGEPGAIYFKPRAVPLCELEEVVLAWMSLKRCGWPISRARIRKMPPGAWAFRVRHLPISYAAPAAKLPMRWSTARH